MLRNSLFLIGITGVIAAAAAACSASGGSTSLGAGGTDPTGTTGKGGASSVSSSASGEELTTGVGGSGPNSGCTATDSEDKDKDGFSINEGDCDDCDATVNPNAIDTPAMSTADGTVPEADNNCDGKITLNETCDQNLALNNVEPKNAAKAIDICRTTTKGKGWGLLSARYIGADGASSRTPGLQVGLRSTFGPNVHTRLGDAMLGLSTGHMRVPGEADACPDQNCATTNPGKPPPGFPQTVPGCPAFPDITDDIALEVSLRAPANATGYKFDFKFYSYEYAEWVCSEFNDQFIALVSPPPKAALNGNISFDSMNNPVSVNVAFFDFCDPKKKDTFGAESCKNMGSCPTPPVSYCPKGITELIGTGMVNVDPYDGGATSWLETTAPIKGGEEFTIRFAIWDTGNQNLDSHVLIDAFQWIAAPGVKLGTGLPPS